MPYKLRKAPKKALYWVVTTETGKKHSKLPISMDKAKAQMRILAGLNGNGMLDDICDSFGECFGRRRSRRSVSPLPSPSSSPREISVTDRVLIDSVLSGSPKHIPEVQEIQRNINPRKDLLGNLLAPPGPNAKAVKKALFGNVRKGGNIRGQINFLVQRVEQLERLIAAKKRRGEDSSEIEDKRLDHLYRIQALENSIEHENVEVQPEQEAEEAEDPSGTGKCRKCGLRRR